MKLASLSLPQIATSPVIKHSNVEYRDDLILSKWGDDNDRLKQNFKVTLYDIMVSPVKIEPTINDKSVYLYSSINQNKKIPVEEFNVGYYLIINNDVVVTRASEAYQHYDLFGFKEGRRALALKEEITPYWFKGSQEEWNETIKTNASFNRISSPEEYKLKYSLQLPPEISLVEIEQILKWNFIFGFQFQPFDLTPGPTSALYFDFNEGGGTYFYSQSLLTYFISFPHYRIIPFFSRYALVALRNRIQPRIYKQEELVSFLVQPYKFIFFNHPDNWAPFLLKAITGMGEKTSLITVLHDLHWAKYLHYLVKFDIIIAQSETIAHEYRKLYLPLSPKLLRVPHPDYIKISTSFSYNISSSLRIAMIGAISPKKGSKQLQTLLPFLKAQGMKLYILGCINLSEFNYEPYLNDQTLTFEPYEGINQFNQLLQKYQPQLLWYHNDLAYTTETWLYTLSLGLLTGIPMILNDVPIMRERAPKANFYTTLTQLKLYLQSYKNNTTSCNLIQEQLYYPRFYYKIFNLDANLYLLRHLDEFIPTLSWKKFLIPYFRGEKEYLPLLNELDVSNYQKSHFDLIPLSEKELIEHYYQYGKSEGRYPNGYRGIIRTPYSINSIIELYQHLYDLALPLRGKQPLQYDPTRKYALFFFETRNTELFEPITRIMLARAQGKANLYIFCTSNNKAFFQKKIPEVKATYIQLDLPATINSHQYSTILKQALIWSQIKEEYIITYQTDSFVYRDIPWEELSSSPYGFLGAWHYLHQFGNFNINTPGGGGMNGGFSFRKKSFLLKAIKELNDTKINEYRNSKGFHTFREVIPEDCFYYHAMEILGLPFPESSFCDRYFLQDRLFDSSTCFSFHGTFYGNVEIKELNLWLRRWGCW